MSAWAVIGDTFEETDKDRQEKLLAKARRFASAGMTGEAKQLCFLANIASPITAQQAINWQEKFPEIQITEG